MPKSAPAAAAPLCPRPSGEEKSPWSCLVRVWHLRRNIARVGGHRSSASTTALTVEAGEPSARGASAEVSAAQPRRGRGAAGLLGGGGSMRGAAEEVDVIETAAGAAAGAGASCESARTARRRRCCRLLLFPSTLCFCTLPPPPPPTPIGSTTTPDHGSAAEASTSCGCALSQNSGLANWSLWFRA